MTKRYEIAYDDHFHGIAEATLEGERMEAAMDGRRILFLANHGVVVVAETLAQAFDDFYYLERACQVLAMQVAGQELNVMAQLHGQCRAAAGRDQADVGRE